jgi:hypothetical protein
MGLHGQPEQPQAVVEVVLPQRRIPLEQLLAAPDVVDQHVEAVRLRVDAGHQRGDPGRVEVVDDDGDPAAAGGGHQLRGLLDGLGAAVLGGAPGGAAAGAPDGRAGRAEGHGDAAPGAAGGPGDQRDGAGQVGRCVVHGAQPAPHG